MYVCMIYMYVCRIYVYVIYVQYVVTAAEYFDAITILLPNNVAMFFSHNHNGRSDANYELKSLLFTDFPSILLNNIKFIKSRKLIVFV